MFGTQTIGSQTPFPPPPPPSKCFPSSERSVGFLTLRAALRSAPGGTPFRFAKCCGGTANPGTPNNGGYCATRPWTASPWQGCIRREATSEAAPEAVRPAVEGGCQSGWGRLLSVTNAIGAGTWRQGLFGNRPGGRETGGRCPPLLMHPCSPTSGPAAVWLCHDATAAAA